MSKKLLMKGKKYRFKSYNHFVFNVSSNTTILLEDTDYNIDIYGKYEKAPTDWGDGTVDFESKHTYSEFGTYEVKTRQKLSLRDKVSGDGIATYSTRNCLIQCLNIDKEETDYLRFFFCCRNLTYVNANIDTSSATNMQQMFCECTSLKSLSLSEWNFSNVTDMSSMFYGCNKLEELHLSNIDTSNVTNMSYMFYNCDALTSIGLSDWDTSNVTDMSYMFYGCYYLISIELSNWDTSNVTNMRFMFCGCSHIRSLDLSNWDTSKVIDMGYMFCYCYRLSSISMSNIDTRIFTKADLMFSNCQKIKNIDLSGWNTQKLTNIDRMFNNCYEVEYINLRGWIADKVTSCKGMFSECIAIISIDISNLDLVSMGNAFADNKPFLGLYELTSANLVMDNCSTQTKNEVIRALGYMYKV